MIVIPGHEQVELPHHMAHAVKVEKVYRAQRHSARPADRTPASGGSSTPSRSASRYPVAASSRICLRPHPRLQRGVEHARHPVRGVAAQRRLQRHPCQRPVAAGIGRECQQHQRLDPPRLREACATAPPTAPRPARRAPRPPARRACRAPAGRSARTPAGPARRRRQLRPSATRAAAAMAVLDVARAVGVRTLADPVCSRRSRRPARRLAAGSVTSIDLLQLGAPGVQPAPVQHRRHRQRRRRRVVHGARVPQPSAQCHRPPAATLSTTCAVEQFDPAARPGSPSTGWRPARGIRRCTSGSSRPPRRPRPRSRRPVSPPRRRRRCARRVHAVHRERSTRITHPISPRSTVTRTRDFSGTKPRTAGKAAISAPGRLSWKSGIAMSSCPDGRGLHRPATPATAPSAVASGDEFATGDELRAAPIAAHLEHRVGEQRVQRLGVRRSCRTASCCSQVALTRTSSICATSVSVRVARLRRLRRHGLVDGIGVVGVHRRRRRQVHGHRRTSSRRRGRAVNDGHAVQLLEPGHATTAPAGSP